MPSGRASSSPSRAWLARFSFGIALVAYALAMAVWEHKVLRLDGAPAAAALLASTKEAFVAGGRSIFSPGDDDGGAANSTAAAGAGVENVALSHRPAHVILQNPRLPDWIKRYASWHAVQRKRYIDFKRGNSTETSVSDIKFLISRCLASDHCGGASDRLQDMPYNMKVANETNRVLLVRWEKPAALENFLVPPANGIDWTIDDELLAWMREDDDNGNFNLKGKESDDKKRFVSTIRRDSAAPIFRQYEINEVGHKMLCQISRNFPAHVRPVPATRRPRPRDDGAAWACARGVLVGAPSRQVPGKGCGRAVVHVREAQAPDRRVGDERGQLRGGAPPELDDIRVVGQQRHGGVPAGGVALREALHRRDGAQEAPACRQARGEGLLERERARGLLRQRGGRRVHVGLRGHDDHGDGQVRRSRRRGLRTAGRRSERRRVRHGAQGEALEDVLKCPC
ncbi:hypothetical protein THAOC_23990 [Thalassiosira oceanica]|uniref:Uncharacterized protein n=1 Tax=Thalassiosira oceanica TaxID=159749 RepID=K0RQZ9_THAOC|nr:hypothetical protein THAOC_23990 [Thalassiosira oceanica]|eukprot:EJK56173.1 hypothetical protein THAOC_23990 [Thalassiosira oceanica]